MLTTDHRDLHSFPTRRSSDLQIATFADHHYMIEKKRSGDRTQTTVKSISGNERTAEIARMLSGAKVTETSLKHAEQMLKANA